MPRRRGWLLVVFPIRGWTPATGQAVLPASESMKMMKIQQWAVKNLCRLLASRTLDPAGYVYSYLIHTEAIWSSSARRTDLSSQRNAGNWQFLAIPQGSDRFDPFIPSLMFETHFFPDFRMRNIQPGIDLKKMTLGIPEKWFTLFSAPKRSHFGDVFRMSPSCIARSMTFVAW